MNAIAALLVYAVVVTTGLTSDLFWLRVAAWTSMGLCALCVAYQYGKKVKKQ